MAVTASLQPFDDWKVDMNQDWEIAEPRASALIESLRAFGYTPEAAIADLIDNSISAKATRIEVDFVWDGRDSVVRIADDGEGMSEGVLVGAMRPGSTSPLDDRDPTDLGRFGLGLKTASFSQARELTVVTLRKSGESAAVRRWDLDVVAETGEWRLLQTLPAARAPRAPETHGTVVQWSKLDRLVGDVDADDKRAHSRFLAIVERVQGHLEATFHRFLSERPRITMSVNGVVLTAWDPFMSKHAATNAEPTEELPFGGDLVKVTPFVLPHASKLSDAEFARGSGQNKWNQQQGFYVYRSRRLLVQGDWLGLGLANDEHTKLARIAVEFPAHMDHAWQVDVKKSTARPPGPLVDDLKRIARATRSKAQAVYRHRGKVIARNNSQSFVMAWHQYKTRDGVTRYKVNREHPVITAVIEASGANGSVVERALRFIEETVPTTLIGVSIADSLDTQPTPFSESKRELTPLADFVYRGLLEDGATPDEALDRLTASEPFLHFPDVMAAFREARQ